MSKNVKLIYEFYLTNDYERLFCGEQYKPFVIKYYEFFLGMWEEFKTK